VSVSTIATDPAFVLIYPYDLDLRGCARALDEALIPHRAAGFPYAPDEVLPVPVVYLVDEAGLATLGPRAIVEQALELMVAGQSATIVVLADPESPADWLASHPCVGGWLVTPVNGPQLVATVRSAAAAVVARDEVARLRGESDHLQRIGLALSAERDLVRLQQTIVRSARRLTHADSGSLYLLEDGSDGERVLRFAVAQTGPDDAGTHLGAVLPLSRSSISGYVALSGEVVRIDDAYDIAGDAEYRFNQSFDRANAYRTKSVLAVPMRDHEDAIVGVIMLINRKPAFETKLASPAHTEALVRAFSSRDERLLLSLASQAGVALENRTLVESIQNLFEQFVTASVKAIEVRDKSTQGHSARVAELTVLQGEAINAVQSGPLASLRFDPDQLREMRYASLLHDFGKVTVPEYIFGKNKKLPDGRIDAVRLRFLLAIEQCGDERERMRLRRLLATVEAANEPLVVANELATALDAVPTITYLDQGEERPVLTRGEIEYLRIPRGSLSASERQTMEQHVTQSFHFLREIPWTKTPWANVPEYAYGHHEHLDGTGYPRGLRAEAIAPQVRLLTISDIFDALTANDRPYKPAMTVERALDILVHEFAERGKVDAQLLDLFIAKRVYEPVLASTLR
jgi:HD-GYP domain-containing protein (c-di-GMP phosphodiesterase class II)